MCTWCCSLISLDFSSIPVPFLWIPEDSCRNGGGTVKYCNIPGICMTSLLYMGDWSVPTWMQMLFCTLLAQWIHETSKLPELLYATFSWNHTMWCPYQRTRILYWLFNSYETQILNKKGECIEYDYIQLLYYIWNIFHMWECTLDPEDSTPNIINSEHHPPLILWIFPILLLFFI